MAITIVQPFVWLFLFTSLFQSVTEIPGFTSSPTYPTTSFQRVVMTALFSSGWSGMGVLDDIERGIMDRFLGRRRIGRRSLPDGWRMRGSTS